MRGDHLNDQAWTGGQRPPRHRRQGVLDEVQVLAGGHTGWHTRPRQGFRLHHGVPKTRLPHTQMLFIMEDENETWQEIDKTVCDEIPDKTLQPRFHDIVPDHGAVSTIAEPGGWVIKYTDSKYDIVNNNW